MGVEGGLLHRSGGHIFATLNHWFIGQVIDTKCIYVLLACINVAIFVGFRALLSKEASEVELALV